MKKIYKLIVAFTFLVSVNAFAQAPQKMSYQAVIRNASNALVTSTAVGMQITILQNTTPVYTETQTPTTNANGLVSIEIGGVSGFSTIDWSAGPYFIKTETDPTGGTTYSITGTSQLLSVPYALHAKTAESITGIVTETDPIFVAWDKDYSDLTNTPTTITTAQASAITANTAKVGYTDALVSANTDVTANTAKVGITTAQSNAITANTAKVGYTDALVSANTDVAANTAKVGITTGQATAITANTAKNTYPAADATKLAGIAAGAEVNVQSDWNQATTTADDFILNKPTIPTAANGSETKVTAGTNVTVTGAGTTASPYVVNASGGATALAIGQSYQGGKIFWLDATGQHGLIAATADQSTGIRWYNGTYRYTGTTGDGLYAGSMNTAMIVATQMADNQTGNFAAKVCADYSVTVSGVTYGDWYLPSKHELNLLYLQKTVVGGFASAYYWSSSEIDNNYAWDQAFDDGFQDNVSKYATDYVRAVRAF